MITTRILLVLCSTSLLMACGASKQHRQVAKAGKALRFELAQMYVEKGAKEQAIPILRRVLAEEPKHHTARVLYASVLRDLALYPQSRRQLAIVLEAEPRHAGAHATLGILYDLQKDHERAAKHHQRAIKFAPGRADYHNNYGFSLFLTGNLDQAIAMFEQALALDPGLALAYNNLGFALGARGDFEAAERTFRTSLDEAGALYNMALVHDAHGDPLMAQHLRKRAFKQNPRLRAKYNESKTN